MKLKKILVLILIIAMIMPISVFAVDGEDLATTTSVQDELASKVTAPIAVLMDGKTGKVLYDKEAYTRAYPASLTKMLTAIVVMEHCNLTDIVTYSDEALKGIEQGYVTASLIDGEQLTVEDLLNLLLIPSANEIGNMLALHVSGNIESFVELMNQKAQEIGCKDSHFMNTNGTHDENHYTTAYDMALIAREAMKHEELREIVSKIYYELGDTNKYTGKTRIYETTNGLLLHGNPTSYYKYAKGIKTGYTTPAGSCLASYAIKDDMELYAVVLKCEGAGDRYSSIKNLYNYGFDSYTYKDIAKRGDNIQTLDVKDATSKTRKLNAILENNIEALVNVDSKYTIEPQVQMNTDLRAPIQQGTKVGTVKYEIEGITYESNLVAGNDVEKTYMPEFFILLFIVLIIVFGISKLLGNHKKKARIRKIKNM